VREARRSSNSLGPAEPDPRSQFVYRPVRMKDADERQIDDRDRLAEEARRQVEQHAQEIRKASVPMETEPAATYRP